MAPLISNPVCNALVRRLLLVCFVVSYAQISAAAGLSAADCEAGNNWDYVNKGFATSSEMDSECVRRNLPIGGSLSDETLRALEVSDATTIVLHPKMPDQWLQLSYVGRSCFSRMYYEVICKQNERLFRSEYSELDECPLPRFNAPSEADLLNIGLNQLGRFRLCTPYSAPALTNPMEIGPGTVKEIDGSARDGEPKVFASLAVQRIVGRALSLSNVLIVGDLSVTDNRFLYIDISHATVIGNVKISGNMSDIQLDHIHVLGNIDVTGNTISGGAFKEIRSLGNVKWSDNTYVKGEVGFYSAQDIDVDGTLTIENNKIANGVSEVDSGVYWEFLKQVRTSYDKTASKQK